jgi:hypothetical protein
MIDVVTWYSPQARPKPCQARHGTALLILPVGPSLLCLTCWWCAEGTGVVCGLRKNKTKQNPLLKVCNHTL